MLLIGPPGYHDVLDTGAVITAWYMPKGSGLTKWVHYLSRAAFSPHEKETNHVDIRAD